MAYMDYIDLTAHCPRKAIKFNHSLTHMCMCDKDIVMFYCNLKSKCSGDVVNKTVLNAWLVKWMQHFFFNFNRLSYQN